MVNVQTLKSMVKTLNRVTAKKGTRYELVKGGLGGYRIEDQNGVDPFGAILSKTELYYCLKGFKTGLNF